MDIVFGDDLKKEIRLGLWLFKKRITKYYKTSISKMIDDLDNCGNPVIARIWKEVKYAADEIKEEYQKEMAIEYPAVILWILYRDTAYMPIFMYVMVKILENKDELLPLAMKYYAEPKDWYVNRWNESKKHTAELKKKKVLVDAEAVMSESEKIFTPPIQHDRLPKYYEKFERELDEERKKRGWRKHAKES